VAFRLWLVLSTYQPLVSLVHDMMQVQRVTPEYIFKIYSQGERHPGFILPLVTGRVTAVTGLTDAVW
jgi:hypothetical protein